MQKVEVNVKECKCLGTTMEIFKFTLYVPNFGKNIYLFTLVLHKYRYIYSQPKVLPSLIFIKH